MESDDEDEEDLPQQDQPIPNDNKGETNIESLPDSDRCFETSRNLAGNKDQAIVSVKSNKVVPA